jgi:hypothetical protein
MSNAALFFSGLLVTLVFSIGIGLLVWGAILDGRYDREVHARLRSAGSDGVAAVVPGAESGLDEAA